MDKFAVIWTRASGRPVKLADMVLTSSQLRITRTIAAASLGIPGPSMIHDRLGEATLNYPRDQLHHLPPQLEALLPPANRDNPQRIILSKLLARQLEIRGMPILEQEWEMLLFAGRGGIGHLDVFRSDADAERYYNMPAQEALSLAASSALWGCFRKLAGNLAKDERELDEILETIGPTPGISGFNPKILANISIAADGRWEGSVSPADGRAAIVKIDTPKYPGIIHLESLCYEIHRKAGLEVPKTWLREVEFGGERFPVMAIERFDRTDAGAPIPIESAFSLLRTGAPGKFYSNTDGSMEDVWKAVAFVSADQVKDRETLFERFALSFLTGNGDLHLENWAVVGAGRNIRLSPVFDPAPMRAYRGIHANHDLLSALPFNGIGGAGDTNLPYSLSGDTPPDLAFRLVGFGETIGMSSRACRERIAELLEITKDYSVAALDLLSAIPPDRRRPRLPDIDGFKRTLAEVRKAIDPARMAKSPKGSPGGRSAA